MVDNSADTIDNRGRLTIDSIARLPLALIIVTLGGVACCVLLAHRGDLSSCSILLAPLGRHRCKIAESFCQS